MKKHLLASAFAAFLTFAGQAHATSYAASVLSYAAGADNTSFVNSSAVLGKPGSLTGASTSFPNVLSPFSPHYESSELTGVGFGGQITLQLQNFALVSPGLLEIGVWSNVGLVDNGGGTTANADTFSAPRSARVSVSADGVNWVFLNGGALITFTNPGTYYLNAGPYDSAAPANPSLADFGKAFTGNLASFANETYDQVTSTLNGSAGGTWLDLDATGLTKVGYIRFDNVPSGQVLYLNGVSVNNAATGAPVPEPSSFLLLAGALALGASRRFRRACPLAS